MPCDLCKLGRLVGNKSSQELRERGHEEVFYDDTDFFVVYCNNLDHPSTPMAVLKAHRVEASGDQLIHITRVMADLFPRRKPRGLGMLTIKDHWHEHWIEEGE